MGATLSVTIATWLDTNYHQSAVQNGIYMGSVFHAGAYTGAVNIKATVNLLSFPPKLS